MKENSEKGFDALKKGDYETASKIFLQRIDDRPESAESHLGYSFSRLGLGDTSEAEKHLKAAFSLFEAQNRLPEEYASAIELLGLNPHNIDYRFILMKVYLRINFLKSFVQLLLETVENEEITEDTLKDSLSSIISYVSNDDIKSLLSFKSKLQQMEEEKLNPFENLELANLLFEIGSTEEAKAEYYKTARAFLTKGMKDKALELYVKMKDLYSDDEGLANLKKDIDNFSEQKQEKSIKEKIGQLASKLSSLKNENEARMRYSFAVIFKEYGRHEEAIRELDKIFELPKGEEHIKAHVLLSQIYIDAGDNKKAIGILTDIIEKGEFSEDELVPLKYKLARIYEMMGELSQALKIYEDAMSINPDYLDLVEKVKKVKESIEEATVKTEEKPMEKETVTAEVKENKEEEEIEEVEKVEILEETELKDKILYI